MEVKAVIKISGRYYYDIYGNPYGKGFISVYTDDGYIFDHSDKDFHYGNESCINQRMTNILKDQGIIEKDTVLYQTIKPDENKRIIIKDIRCVNKKREV